MEFSKSDLFEIVYGNEPMTKTLAEGVKRLRCGKRMGYEKLPNALNSGFGNDFTLGKELCIKAKCFWGESGEAWDWGNSRKPQP
jgi:hypothetical protein